MPSWETNGALPHSWQIVAGFRQRLHGVGDWQTELDREIVITLVATRHGHDGAGAVIHKHIVCGEQRQLGSGDRVDGVQAGEQAGLLARLVHAVLGGLGFRGHTVGLHSLDRSGVAPFQSSGVSDGHSAGTSSSR